MTRVFHDVSFQNNRQSASTDIDADELNLDTDPIVETHEGGEQVYRQQVYLRQYQPPTPEPIDIQVQEVVVKPQVQRPPIHVYVGPGQNRDAQRTPSPILIKSVPPQPPPAASEPVVYNKYIPIDYKPPPQQVCSMKTISKIASSFFLRLDHHSSISRTSTQTT